MDIDVLFNGLNTGYKSHTTYLYKCIDECDFESDFSTCFNNPMTYLEYCISTKNYKAFEWLLQRSYHKLLHHQIMYLIQDSIKRNDSIISLILQKNLK